MSKLSILLGALALACCTLADPIKGSLRVDWHLDTNNKREAYFKLPVDTKPSRLIVTIAPLSAPPETLSHFLQVSIFCPDDDELLKDLTITDFPVGEGGRFAISLFALEEKCSPNPKAMTILVKLSLIFVDKAYPLSLKGNMFIDE